MISKLLKNDKTRENSTSAQSYYTEKQQISKLGKSKACINQKFTSRNSENPSTTEFSIVNTNSFSTNLITFKRQRPSVDVVSKIISNTINNEIITPRNKKLIPKVSLLKKLPSESNERGQSSNYRRIRVGRLGRKESDTTEERKIESLKQPRCESSLNRSNSNQGSKLEGLNSIMQASKNFILKENVGFINVSQTNEANKSKVIQENLMKSKLRIEREDSKKRSDHLDENQPLNENFKATDENLDCGEEPSIPKDGLTCRQRRIRCIDKFNFIDKSMK